MKIPVRAKRTLCICIASMTLAVSMKATATSEQPHTQNARAVESIVENFARRQTRGLHGEVVVSVGSLDPRLSLPACADAEAFSAPGSRLWGQSTVGVRCRTPKPWVIYVPVTVRVTGNHLVTARPLSAGQILSPQDLTITRADLSQLPAGIVVEPAQAVGRVLRFGLGAGQALRQDMLRAPSVIQNGQTVQLVAQGLGFRIVSEGKALGQAADGQIAQVRTANGRMVSGVARTGGSVEVRF